MAQHGGADASHAEGEVKGQFVDHAEAAIHLSHYKSCTYGCQFFCHNNYCVLQNLFCNIATMLNHPEFANPVLSEEETRNLFAPHAADIVALIDHVWAQWESCPQRTMLDARARAAFLSSLFRYEAKRVFGDDNKNGVHFAENGNSFFLYFGTQAKTRFKKLKANGKYSNIMTGTQLKLMKQMHMPFMPGTYLTIGYQLDSLAQGIFSKKITLQSRSGVVYAINLNEIASASRKVPNIAPIPQVPPQTVAPRARVRKEVLRSIKKKKSNGRE